MSTELTDVFQITRQRFRERIRPGDTFLIGQLLLAAGALLLSILDYLQTHEIRQYNSDLLYLPALFKDMTLWGGSIWEWRLTPSPYFFPDMALYFPLAGLLPNWHVAYTITAVMQFLLFTAGWCLLGRFYFRQQMQYLGYVSFVLVTVAALFTLIPGVASLRRYQFLITYHFGLMLLLPYFLVLTLQLIASSRRQHPLYLLMTLFLGSLFVSDRLALPQLAFPLLLAIFFLWLLHTLPGERALRLGLSILGGLLLAELAQSWLVKYQPLPTPGNPLVQRMGDALSALGFTTLALWEGQNRGVLLLLLLALLVHAAVILVAVYRASGQHRPRPAFLFLSVFAVASALLSVVAVVGTGRFRDAYSARYLYPLIVLPIYTLLPLGYRLLGKLRGSQFLVALVAALILIATVPTLANLDQLQKYTDYHPEWVACVDRETAERGLQAGASGYWDAKFVSMLSGHNLLISQVRTNFTPYVWISNPHWYSRFPPQFVLYDPDARQQLQMGKLINTYGYPQEVVDCSERELWLYNRPQDIFFQRSFADNPLVVNWCEPGTTHTAPPYVWRGDTGVNIGSAIVAENEAGTVASGFLPDHPQGTYELTLTYRHEGNAAVAQIGELRVGIVDIAGSVEDIKWLDVPLAATAQSSILRFELPDNRDLHVHVYFAGEGTLTLEEFRLQKLAGNNCP